MTDQDDHDVYDAAAAGILAISLSLATVTRHGSGGAVGSAVGSATAVGSGAGALNVDDAAFSVHTDAKTGVETVTLKQLEDPSQLQQLLEHAGVPLSVMVEPVSANGQLRTWSGATRVPTAAAGGPTLVGGCLSGSSTITFTPTLLPKNAVVGVLYFEQGGNVVSSTAAVLSNRPTGCTTG